MFHSVSDPRISHVIFCVMCMFVCYCVWWHWQWGCRLALTACTNPLFFPEQLIISVMVLA